MNFPENNPAPPAESAERKAIIELRKTVASMRLMFHVMALCALMLTATLFVLFFKQVSAARRQLDNSVAYIHEYNRAFVPQIEIVRANLESFTKTNETLAPLMRRYFSTNMAKSSAGPTTRTNR